ncbi:MAG: PAS domain S-box protein [Bacteroidales bacterium]|nr:PAS domain S-box protein [Bacteroidales bacterium]
MKKIHIRLIVLISLRLAVLIIGLLILYRFEISRLKIIKKDTEEQKKYLFDKMVELRGKPLETFAFDYTYWDEMVNFIKTPFTENSKTWAKETIESALPTYEANFVWIYNNNFGLVYYVNNIKKNEFSELNNKTIKNIFYNSKKSHFFINSPAGLIEMNAASIHPSNDYNRLTAPRGYFIVGKLWSKNYIDEISKLTQTKINITPIINSNLEAEFDEQSEKVRFSKLLYDYSGKPLVKLSINTQSATMQKIISLTQYTLYVSILFLFFAIVIISLFSMFSIKRPISLLIKSLQTEDTIIIDKLIKKEKSEFGILARLIASFFEQRNLLIEQKTELSETKIRLHAFVDNIPFVAWLKDKDSKFIAVNEPYAKLTGHKTEDIIGKDDFSVWPEDFAEFNMASDKEVITSKQQNYFDEKLTFIKNEPWYEVYKTPIINEKGEVIGITGIAKDITINKKADKFTKKQRDLIKIMLDSLQESIIMSSIDGFILECNDTTLNLFNIISKEKIINSSIFELFPGNIKDQVIEHMSFILENGGSKDFSYKYFTKDGHKNTLKSSISFVYNSEGKPSNLIIITRKSKTTKPGKAKGSK